MDSFSVRRPLFLHDVGLISIMAVLAACGLVYEYLLSYYTARVLGAVETVIYSMIGVMIVAMGLGAFAAKLMKNPFTAFAWLEIVIALLGCSSILLIAITQAFSAHLPRIINEIFLLPPDVIPDGGIFLQLDNVLSFFPYFIGFLLGFFIGMEIPLIARVRETIYGRHLKHNAGTIYGADYIGAGVGAAIWVLIMLRLQMTTAAAVTALANIIAGAAFIWRYYKEIKLAYLLVLLHILVLALALIIAQMGNQWLEKLTDTLYRDQVVHSQTTPYQHFAVTQRHRADVADTVYNFYINGRLQFSSNDEYIYHSMLVYPAMLAAARRDKVLVIGGGDGLALRDVLRWQPQQITLIDLDAQLVSFFTEPDEAEELADYRRSLLALNQRAFSDPRVELIFADAFVEIDRLIAERAIYDVIIVDLPDPSHPDLNKLYSRNFYYRLGQLLSGDGVLVSQSTSPYHARNAFISIGKTVSAAGFAQVEQYHQNVPSFGQWGWTIATKLGAPASERIEQYYEHLAVEDDWITLETLLASFNFPKYFYDDQDQIKVNRLGTHAVYQYHQDSWKNQQGMLDIPRPAGIAK